MARRLAFLDVRRAWVSKSRLTGIASRMEFQLALERERTRADRTGQVFCLLVFTVDRKYKYKALVHLARVLRARLRKSDQSGWISEERIGVLLPDTPGPGGEKVARDVVAMLAARSAAPAYRLFAYPSSDACEGTCWPEDEEPVDTRGAGRELRLAEPMEVHFTQGLPAWKRGVDIAGASAGLLVSAPLCILIALCIKLDSRGPVLFKQLRSGRAGKPFWLYKFRSMVVGAEAQQAELREQSEQDGPAFKLTNDPRTTRLGRFLRTTSLDELPQLWNVLKGDMSLVGPRPLPVHETEGCQGWLRRRLDATPGLTCIWQIEGRSRVTFDDWVRMDLRYIGSRTLWHDLKLLALTIPAVVLRRGAR